ncbi:uncharacterized protein LOC121390046 isoform X2 [Gigantopelta aegis]|uniref:uncharacterized protein LOC121390046 isoform X2 n=1 Tax=Gigantopelta aegis TaxID=1735272 RepID=UPI001B88B6E1|nr:uncharacterized protein LOC121390046 isoform X2 [Gigantopelta aegis]
MLLFVLILAVCGLSGTDAYCPRGEQIGREIAECFQIVNRIRGPNEPFCSKVWRSVDCVDQLVNQCHHLPDWQAVINSGALDTASQQMQQTCGQRPTNGGQGNSNNVDTVDQTCTTNLMNEMVKCSAGFKAFGEAPANERRSKCGEVRESVSCIESLAVRCPQSSLVQKCVIVHAEPCWQPGSFLWSTVTLRDRRNTTCLMVFDAISTTFSPPPPPPPPPPKKRSK